MKTRERLKKGVCSRQMIKKRIVSSFLVAGLVIAGIPAGNIQAHAAVNKFAAQMQAEGFPDSYISSLTELHDKYPNWKFEAVNTGLDWNTVIEKESKNGLNLVPKSSDDAMKSTAAGAYDWFTNTWTVYDGSSWVGAHPDYIARYMDPRNFLTETDIFQFEDLSFHEAQTREGVCSILNGTFMTKNVVDTDDTVLNYADAFMSIGEETGVSPYHLASRVRQEQGLKGTSSLISGTYKGFEGYFNYFNVNASGKTNTAVIKNGLTYAKNSGWDSRYKSLYGGSRLLAKNYIAVGQNTLYFQKFNVVNTKKLYDHQYMQNVTAAYNEGRKLGQGYADKQQAFVFRIPVYDAMPDNSVAFNAAGNPNNYLKTLKVDKQTLSPAFRGSQTSYTVTVPADTTSVTVSAVPVASTSTVTGTGTKKLTKNSTTINIKCRSGSGVTKTYKITVKKDAPAGIPVSTQYTVGKDEITGIEPQTTVSAFLGKMTAKNMTMKVTGANGKAKTGTVATGDKLELYDKNKKKLSSYTLIIFGDVNGDGIIDIKDLGAVNEHILETKKLGGCYLKAADTDRKGDGVTVLDLVYLNRYLAGEGTIQQQSQN